MNEHGRVTKRARQKCERQGQTAWQTIKRTDLSTVAAVAHRLKFAVI